MDLRLWYEIKKELNRLNKSQDYAVAGKLKGSSVEFTSHFNCSNKSKNVKSDGDFVSFFNGSFINHNS